MKKLLYVLVAALCCTSIQAQKLNESFEGATFPPEGWITAGGSQYSQWIQTTKEGRKCAYVLGSYGAPESYLITPELQPAAGETLQFSARVKDNTSKGQLRVEVSTTGTETSSFTVVETFYTSSKAETNKIPKSDWGTFSVDLSAYVGQRIFVAFHQANECDGIYLDDVKGVSIAGNATCDKPTDITVSNLTNESATISWQGDAAQFQYIYVLGGEAPDWAEAVKTDKKSVTLTGLYESTAYDFYVRSYCSESEQSLAPKTAFKTPCELQSIPWIETFSRDATGDVQPDCWTVASETPQVWVVADKTYNDEGEAQVIYGQAHLGVSGGGPNTAQVFALPVFDAPLNTLEIAFNYHTNVVSANYGVPEIGYMTNASDPATFVSLETLPQTIEDVRKTVVLSAVPADVQFIAFRFAGGTSDLGGLSMDNFVVAEIGKSGEIDPSQEQLPDADIYRLSYCEASFTWYGYNTEAFAIGLFSVEDQALVAGIVATTGECDRFAYTDKQLGLFDGFSEDDDYENHFYCSTRWILNAEDEDGSLAKGDAWDKCVRHVSSSTTPLLGLRPGKYQVQIYPYSTTTGQGALISTIQFELEDRTVTNLEVAIAEDKKSATFTWEQPALSTGERLYVSVRAGETVAFDNFDDTKVKAVSPLTVEVVEGKSYEAIFQLVDKNNTPLGSEVTRTFTVGTNPYEPVNPHAEVFSGDNVTFSWEVTTEADAYDIVLLADGEYYASLTVHGTTKTTTMPKDATWSWTVQAFTKGENGNYFPASVAVAGNDFVSKGADIPDDAIVLNVAEMDAFYIEPTNHYYQEGLNSWIVQFATGEEGYPLTWFLVYTEKEFALSGVYNPARQNLDLESTMIIPQAGNPQAAWLATDAELRLTFDGFDEELMEQGYRYAYYTGSFRLVNDGKTYIAKFMEVKCNSFGYTNYETGNPLTHVGMWDEDPDAHHQGWEDITADQSPMANKVILDGQLLILRDGRLYNAQGARVR